jgi:hypothetical protein
LKKPSQSVLRTRFEPGISLMQIKNVTDCVNLLGVLLLWKPKATVLFTRKYLYRILGYFNSVYIACYVYKILFNIVACRVVAKQLPRHGRIYKGRFWAMAL